jgi:hypothetical protein
MKLTPNLLRRIIKEEIASVKNGSSRSKKHSLRFLLEDATPEKVDQKLYPTKLSDVDGTLADILASKGSQEDDDIAKVSSISKPAVSLKASQTNMDFKKFVGMAIQMMGKIGGFKGGAGGDLDAIISSDMHIMDGHHRWAATLMVDPSASVNGIGVNLPGEKLVGVLNVWTIANGGQPKFADADLASLSGDSVAKKFKELCINGGEKLPSPEEILEAFKEQGFESIDAAAAHVKKNWDKTEKSRSIEGWMPAKPDMPSIEPPQLKKVAKDISTGMMDLNPEYSSELKAATGDKKEKKEKKTQEESFKRDIVFERWEKLAGLIK